MVEKFHYATTLRPMVSSQRLDITLVEILSSYSRSSIKKWILNGFVSVNGIVIDKPKSRVFGNEYIQIDAEIENESYSQPQNIALKIIYEDSTILVLDKPSNLVVHPGAGRPNGTLMNALLYHYPSNADLPRAGIVHRLDKDTTGLMIVAKTTLAQKRLVEMLQNRKVTREYEAIVVGNISNRGIVDQPISRHTTKRTRMSVNTMGKHARTHYYIIEKFSSYTHLGLRLESGRTHQIRVHMSYINYPLLGDPVYGRRLSSSVDRLSSPLYRFYRQALHASRLCFFHPITNVKIELFCSLPEDMAVLIAELRKSYKNDKLPQ
jgi:23S rRNA pseudouridine1911/1915/1917 synthase